MSHRAVYLAALILVASLTRPATGAAPQKTGCAPGLTVYGALPIPVGDFGEDGSFEDLGYDTGLGAAAIGFGAGVEYRLPFGPPGLSWASSAWVIANGVDEGRLLKQLTAGFALFDLDITDSVDVGFYWNIPVLTGVRYDRAATDAVSVYGTVQMGVNVLAVPEPDFYIYAHDSLYYSEIDATMNHDIATSFGLCLGGGVVVWERYDVGVRWMLLGSPTLEGIYKGVQCYGDVRPCSHVARDIGGEQPVSILTIVAGVSF